MSKSPFARWRVSLSNHRSTAKKSARKEHRRMAFESLERRELLAVSALADFSVNSNTGEKPQSKVWEYNDTWYSVMPDKTGTWVWELAGNQWQKELQLTSNGYSADVKVDGNLAHILLFDGASSQLATVEYDHGVDNRYEMWSLRPSLVNVAVNGSAETAVIDIDSTGRMWVAYDTSSTIEVRYADFGNQYTNWSAPITVASGIKSDDIGTVVAMPNGQIGVMWSNQNTKLFGFRVHVDGAAPGSWLTAESPASQSAQNKGGGFADDHLHLSVASDGTVYAAVKTSYDSSSYPRMVLLVRRPSGVWDNLYTVDTVGTRPIVVINEAAGKLIVAYTESDSGGAIYYKESPLQNISFGARKTLMSGGLNNVSSVKGSFNDEVVAIAGTGSKVKSALFRFDGPVSSPPNLAPAVNAGVDRTIQFGTAVALDGTVTDETRPNGTLTTQWTKVSGPGSVTFGNGSAIDTNATFSVAGTYVLQLMATAGQLTTVDTVTIVVQAPAPPPPPPGNTPPTVSAGPNQTIQLPAQANLNATVTDAGGPLATPTVSWTRVSGPGTVTFGNATSKTTTAQFSVAGTYVLRITVSDGEFQSFSDVTITVQAAPPPTTSDSGGSKAGSRLLAKRG
jgi:hypothetical protein